MKKKFQLPFFLVFFSQLCSAQILCIYCYDRNDSISAGVNNLILNGSFENGCNVFEAFCPNSLTYQCNIANWQCTGGGYDTYAEIIGSAWSSIPNGIKAAYFGNDFCEACGLPDDVNCLTHTGCTAADPPNGYPFNNSGSFGGTSGVSLEQTVSGLIIGDIYVLEFWAGGESGVSTSGLFAVNIGFGDTFMRDKPTGIGDTGTRFIIEFKATSISHTIRFTNWGHICTNCTELILDDVRLYTLAELDSSIPDCTVIEDINNLSPIINHQLLLSPNPASSSFVISQSSFGNAEEGEVEIRDILGRVLLTQYALPNTQYNISALPAGIYFVQLKTKEGIESGKLVKE